MNRHPGGEEQTIHLLKSIELKKGLKALDLGAGEGCLLYTSDAADERSSVDLGGRPPITKQNRSQHHTYSSTPATTEHYTTR